MRRSESATRGVPRPTYLPVVAHRAVERPVKSLREIWRDVARCGEIWRDVGRYGEMWGDIWAVRRVQEPAVRESPGDHPHRHDEYGYYYGVLRRLLTEPRTYYGRYLLWLVVWSLRATTCYGGVHVEDDEHVEEGAVRGEQHARARQRARDEAEALEAPPG